MLGLAHDRSAPDLPGGHGDRPNEIALAALGLDEDEPQLFVAVHDALMRRLLGQAGAPLADWQIAYRRLIGRAYPERLLGDIAMGDLANAIGHFQALAFVTRDVPWDRYLAGDAGAIGEAAKRGALLFYGKARCAACHSGPLFSDFQFHSLAAPQIGPGIDESGDDRGRFEATRIPRHLYQFRTAAAPQRSRSPRPTSTAAPSRAWRTPSTTTSRRRRGRGGRRRETAGEEAPDPAIAALRRESFSPMLRRGVALSEDERASLLAFLGSLEDAQAGSRPLIVPDSVPSGLPVPALEADD